jgi:hypothetical protein
MKAGRNGSMHVNSREFVSRTVFSVASLRMNVLSILAASIFVISAIPLNGATTAPTAVSGVNSHVVSGVPKVGGVAGAAAGSSGASCVSNGFLTAQVDNLSGLYGFEIGSCATAGVVSNYILFGGLWSSFVTVADFTSGVYYTEGGNGGGKPLGKPTSSGIVDSSIVTVFPATAEGLVVTQNITVAGSAFSDSAILMNVKVLNTNANPQEVGIRYLWDTQVGGYDGTWLQEYDGTTAGVITGYETVFSPPPASFTAYAMGGCSEGSADSSSYVCDSSDFGAGSGTFSVSGSISTGPGATTPAKFVYGRWGAMFGTAYRYAPNPLNEIGSFVPNVGGTQDSAMLYYFSNETLPGLGGTLSDQADISSSPNAITPSSVAVTLSPPFGAVGTSVTVTGTGLAPLRNVTLKSFGNSGPVTLSGLCVTDASGSLASSAECTFLVPTSPVGLNILTFSDGTNAPVAAFIVVLPGANYTITVLAVTCNRSSVVVGSLVTCKATVQGSTPAPTGSVSWSSSGPGGFSSLSCRLSGHGTFSTCSVDFQPISAGSHVLLKASYTGDSKNSPSTGKYNLVVTPKTAATTASCSPSSVTAGSSKAITCTARVTGFLPTGIITWSQSGAGSVSFAATSCTLYKSTYYYLTYSKNLILHKLPVGICSVTLTAAQAGGVTLGASYGGDTGNKPSSGARVLKIGKATTAVSIGCPSTTLSVGVPVACTATILKGYSQTGTVAWSRASGAGGLTFSSTTCTLSSGSCSVTVTPTAAGSVKIKAAYGGDSNNLNSSGTLALTVT